MMRRTQIYLTDEEDRALERESRRTGRSKAALIRDAIDSAFGVEAKESRRRFEQALRSSAGAWSDITDEEVAALTRLRAGWSDRQRELLADEQR